MNAKNLAQLALVALGLFGTTAGAKLSIAHFRHGEVCPMLGPIPACNIVFFGYLLVLLAALIIRLKSSKHLFFIGWLPVIGLALAGVIVELIRGDTCPPGGFGIPQCFYSLAMASAVILLFFFVRKRLSFT